MGSDEPRVATGHWPESSALNVEDLLEELATRAAAAKRGHDQLEALLDAVTAVTADLELAEVLGRIVRSACSLVNARYGALGVLAPDGEHLAEFVTHGISPEERHRIGDPPKGHGVLGLLIHNPRPQRLSDITVHPDSYGFPPNHPEMKSFLGTPIRIRDEVFGNLYLAERRGEKEFTDADEAMLVALAAAAGVAIENARLYERAQRQGRWARASSILTQSLLEANDEDLALGLMVDQVCRLTGAALGCVALRDDTGRVSVRAARRSGKTDAADASDGWPVLEGPRWDEVFDASQNLLWLPGEGGEGSTGVVSALAASAGLERPGPVAVVPIPVGAGDIGYILAAWAPGDADTAAGAMTDLAAFAVPAGLALTAARARQDRAMLATLEDRDRIARDMHDHVIQRLFATGLALQSAAKLATHPLVQKRLDEAVSSLDLAIKDIRSTIFDLRAVSPISPPVVDLQEIVLQYAEMLGFPPALELIGDLSAVEDALQDDVVAVVREGLSNMARHAHAGSGRVRVTCGSEVSVEVIDDGVGTGGRRRDGGLANLESRATSRGGTFTVTAAEPTGTRLTWRVPLPGVGG